MEDDESFMMVENDEKDSSLLCDCKSKGVQRELREK